MADEAMARLDSKIPAWLKRKGVQFMAADGNYERYKNRGLSLLTTDALISFMGLEQEAEMQNSAAKRKERMTR